MSTLALRLLLVCGLVAGGVGGAFAQDKQTSPTAAKIAHFHLSGELSEKPKDDTFDLSGDQSSTLRELVERLDKAGKDASVKAVAITYDSTRMGYGQTEELRQALERLKAAGKPVWVHLGGEALGVSTRVYLLFAGATRLSVEPTSDVWLSGIYGESLFLKGLLDKIGVSADFLQMGEYKSAAEMLTRIAPSPAAEANMNWLLDGLYGAAVDMIARSRSMDSAKVRQLIDQGPYSAQQAMQAKLVDALEYRDQFVSSLKKQFGEQVKVDNRYGQKKKQTVDLSSPLAVFSLLSKATAPAKKLTTDTVALVYVSGMILPGYEKPSLFGGSNLAYSGNITKALEKLLGEEHVKAVVLRVDSPGGSALASEEIWRATQLFKGKKPVVVSMGNVAASGGYYVSCGADAILADAETITASIGVLGGKLVTTGMWQKLGVNWVPWKRGANADIFSTLHPFEGEQRAKLLAWMQQIYGTFKERVSQGRGKKLAKPIQELAEGRVFTGAQAKDLGLVDSLGGLSDAVTSAAQMAKTTSYEVRVFPEPKSFLEQLAEGLSETGEKPTDISLRSAASPEMSSGLSELKSMVFALGKMDPQRSALVMQALGRLELLQAESVITMMPEDLLLN